MQCEQASEPKLPFTKYMSRLKHHQFEQRQNNQDLLDHTTRLQRTTSSSTSSYQIPAMATKTKQADRNFHRHRECHRVITRLTPSAAKPAAPKAATLQWSKNNHTSTLIAFTSSESPTILFSISTNNHPLIDGQMRLHSNKDIQFLP